MINLKVAPVLAGADISKLRGALAQIWHVGGTNEQVAILGARPA